MKSLRIVAMLGSLVAGAGVDAVADVTATVLMRSGERVSGQPRGARRRRRCSSAPARNDQRRLPFAEVALIDLVGGAQGLPESELREARGGDHLLLERNGTGTKGRLLDIDGGRGTSRGHCGEAHVHLPHARRRGTSARHRPSRTRVPRQLSPVKRRRLRHSRVIDPEPVPVPGADQGGRRPALGRRRDYRLTGPAGTVLGLRRSAPERGSSGHGDAGRIHTRPACTERTAPRQPRRSAHRTRRELTALRHRQPERSSANAGRRAALSRRERRRDSATTAARFR